MIYQNIEINYACGFLAQSCVEPGRVFHQEETSFSGREAQITTIQILVQNRSLVQISHPYYALVTQFVDLCYSMQSLAQSFYITFIMFPMLCYHPRYSWLDESLRRLR
jgi:hypothetical protein